MKNYNEIMNDIHANYEAKKEAEKELEKLTGSYRTISNLRERHEARKAVEEKTVELSGRISDYELTAKILLSNAKAAAANEVLPKVLETLEKYIGKPMGEKTEKKIRNEIFEKTGFCVFIHSEEVRIRSKNGHVDITVGARYENGERAQILINNKIQHVDFSGFEIWCENNKYVENIPERIVDLKRLKAEAIAKRKELETICSEYNLIAVGSIERLYAEKVIF